MSNKMVFPIDVEKQASKASKLVGNEKVKLIFFLIAMANGLIMLFTVPFFTALGIPWWMPVAVQVILQVGVGIFVIRTFYIKEEDRLRELTTNTADNYVKYFYLRNLESSEVFKTLKRKINIYEYKNGTAMFVVALKFGSNDNRRARNTRQAMRDILNYIGKTGLVYREFDMKEDFSKSYEYRVHVDKLSRNTDLKLSSAVLEINQEAMNFSNQESTTSVRYVMVQTQYSSQSYNLFSAIETIMRILGDLDTAFRSVEFLDKEELVEFLRVFYKLGAIDLAMMKSSLPSETISDFDSLVSIYQIIGRDKNGKERKLTDFEAIDKNVKPMKRIK